MKRNNATTKAISPEERVRRIIHCDDWCRIDLVGGYKTEYTIEHGKVYWAALNPGKEYQATELVVLPVDEFIAQHGDAELEEDILNEHPMDE